MGVVVRRYIDFLILLIPTPLVSVLFCSSILLFAHFLMFSFLNYVFSCGINIRATTDVPRKPYEGLHIMFIHQEAHTNERLIY